MPVLFRPDLHRNRMSAITSTVPLGPLRKTLGRNPFDSDNTVYLPSHTDLRSMKSPHRDRIYNLVVFKFCLASLSVDRSIHSEVAARTMLVIPNETSQTAGSLLRMETT